MTFFRNILGIVFALALTIFCIFNRHPSPLYWNPVREPEEIPVYAIILTSTLLGFFWGAWVVFVSHHKTRQERRIQKKKIRSLEKEIQEMQKPQIPGMIQKNAFAITQQSQ